MFFIATVAAGGLSSADTGGIPLDPDITFDETAQNAIIAWNGTVECLMLSTDLRSEVSGRLMEVLPLPSAPYDIKMASTDSFVTITSLFNEKMDRLQIEKESLSLSGSYASAGGGVDETSGVKIVFSETAGVHNLTVVLVESQKHFLGWAKAFADSQGVSNLTINERFNASIGNHLSRDIRFFVFDVIDLSAGTASVEPVSYFFNTTYLYYPMNITLAALDPESGPMTWNKVSLFFLTDGQIERYSMMRYLSLEIRRDYRAFQNEVPQGFDEFIEFSKKDLDLVSRDVGKLFRRSAFAGHVSGMLYRTATPEDIVITSGQIGRPSPEEVAAQYVMGDFIRSIKPLRPSTAYFLLRGTVDPEMHQSAASAGLVLVAVVLSALIGGFIYRRLLGDKGGRSDLFIDYLALYCAAVVFTFLFALLGYDPVKDMPGLLMLVLFMALPPVFILGLRQSRWNPSLGKRSRLGIAMGVSSAQTVLLLFVPNQGLAFLFSNFCIFGLFLSTILVLMYNSMERRQGKRLEGPL